MDIDRAIRLVEYAQTCDISDATRRWVAVGYLAEAADACLPEQLEAAEELRLERLVLMDDIAHYTPDYTSLLARLQALK